MPTVTATIANGQALSGAVDLWANAPYQTNYDPSLMAIITPPGWDTQDITFQVSVDGTNYFNLKRLNGSGVHSEYAIVAAVASDCYTISSAADFASFRYLKVRSGTSASPQNQNGAVVLTLVMRDL